LEIKSSAPGKIIITGEHAVVYGSKAISCAINLYTVCNLKISKENVNLGNFIVNLPNLGLILNFDKNNLLMIKDFVGILMNRGGDALEEFIINQNSDKFVDIIQNKFGYKSDDVSNSESRNLTNIKLHFIFIFNLTFAYSIIKLAHCDCDAYIKQIEIFEKFFQINFFNFKISSDNAGLGSSAAYNSSIVNSLLVLSNHILYSIEVNLSNQITALNLEETTTSEQESLICLSLAGEKLFHSKPSGLDNVTSAIGGVILFENLKKHSQLNKAYEFLNKFDLYLIDTKVRRETKTFIAGVSNFKANFEKIFFNSINSINNISIIISEIIENSINENSENDIFKFRKLIEINQNLLDIIQVSTNEINEIVLLLRKKKVSSKLTGAGGGGFVLAFFEKNQDKEFLKSFPYPFIKCGLNTNGCKVEKI
jgi:mevalonate kinase